MACALLLVAATASGGELIGARIGGQTLDCGSVQPHQVPACAGWVLRRLRALAEQSFVDEHGLRATTAEIEAFRAYEDAFARHDAEQRARKLAELEVRLARMDAHADTPERARLLEFRAVLERLAAFEADVAEGRQERFEVPAETVAHWIEQAKLDPLLYARYGGLVGLRASGAYAHSARAALVADYIARERVEFPDARIEGEVLALLHAPPAIVYRGDAPDFTPFWLRPLVPSYVSP